MRVVAGEHKGRKLYAPRRRQTRPTSERVREALFDILGDVSGTRVLDLYAGSGALGVEALSRGATTVVFVDRDPAATAAIRRNLGAIGRADARVHRRDALAFLAACEERFDLVFLDPPYDLGPHLAVRLSERLPGVLAQGARTVTESDTRTPLELSLPLLVERSYGHTHIAVHG